ncbi:MAG: transposon-transfer assisting family protein [Oscillospiraceae bacterium]|nr:transposon-transfer assisting family protein [Oscillospiraceae bacterium]
MKENFTFEEQQLMSIYNPGTRLGLIRTLVEMRTYLDKDEQDLKDLTDSAIAKLNAMTDVEFAELDLIPDFGEGA